MKKRFQPLLSQIQSALRTPSAKQKEAYGRFFHTMSAASFIGSITVIFSGLPVNANYFWKVAALIFFGVVLFLIGAILSKGE